MNKLVAIDLLFGLWIISEMIVFRRDRQEGTGQRRDLASRLVIIVAITGAIVLAFGASARHFADLPGPWPAWYALGAMLMVAGIAYRHRAVRWLGEYFRTQVTILDTHKLITDGPYSRVRHPSYTGVVMSCAGVGLAFGNAIALAAMLLLTLFGLVYRIRVEERALAGRFGAEWTAYAQRTSALVPGLW